jgi:hypothetical protein
VGPHFLGYRSGAGNIVEEVSDMSLLTKARSVFRNLFLASRVEADLDDEVQSHLKMVTEENVRAGMPPAEAQRAA